MEDVKLFNDKKINDIVDYLLGKFETKVNTKIKEVQASDTYVNLMIEALTKNNLIKKIEKKYSNEVIDKIVEIITLMYPIFNKIDNSFSSAIKLVIDNINSININSWTIENIIDKELNKNSELTIESLNDIIRQQLIEDKNENIQNIQHSYANNKMNINNYCHYSLREYLKAKIATITITSLEELESIIDNSINYNDFIYTTNSTNNDIYDCDCE